MPAPREGESREAFIERCMPIVLEEGTAADEAQAYAVCLSYWEEKMPKRKTYRGTMELKEDGDAGTFRSVFAQFNVVDHDGDVTLPGAFHEGQPVVIEGWNHDYGLPVGKGVIHSNEREAWVDGAFFLDTTTGRDHYNALKGLAGIEEWSYTFEIEESDRGDFDSERVRFLKMMDVWGVAPVTRGAGLGTRTLALKSAGYPAFTEAEIVRLKALVSEDDGRQTTDEGSDSEETEGEAVGETDGKPSGAPPSVVVAEIDIMSLEE